MTKTQKRALSEIFNKQIVNDDFCEHIDYCDDCGEEKATRQYTSFDYSVFGNEEPMEICHDCWETDKHKSRLKEDEKYRRYDEEFLEEFLEDQIYD